MGFDAKRFSTPPEGTLSERGSIECSRLLWSTNIYYHPQLAKVANDAPVRCGIELIVNCSYEWDISHE